MSGTPAAPTDSDPPSNVLLLAPPIGTPEDRLCGDLLRTASDQRPHVVFCCFRSSAAALDVWDEHVGLEPASKTVIDVDAGARSAATAGATADRTTVERVADPTDLLTIGRLLSRRLDRPGESVLCFRSLTDILQYVEEGVVFRFLDVLTDAVERSDAVAHYHVDPDAHEHETLRTFEVHFDAVIDPREDSDGEGKS